MSELDDMSLMRSYQAGETQALAELMRRRERWLYNVARKTIVDPSLVEDGLQEGLIQIFRSAKTFRGDSQVTSWLYQVMTRACIDVLRKEKVREHDSMPENAEELIPSESHFEREIENKLFIHGALADLDPARGLGTALLQRADIRGDLGFGWNPCGDSKKQGCSGHSETQGNRGKNKFGIWELFCQCLRPRVRGEKCQKT
jgi:RNA polymerase sigma-70 factor (ECF subfamily)